MTNFNLPAGATDPVEYDVSELGRVRHLERVVLGRAVDDPASPPPGPLTASLEAASEAEASADEESSTDDDGEVEPEKKPPRKRFSIRKHK